MVSTAYHNQDRQPDNMPTNGCIDKDAWGVPTQMSFIQNQNLVLGGEIKGTEDRYVK